MRVLKFAATMSLAAAMVALGAGHVRADHDGWWDRRGAPTRQNTQQNWWSQPRYAPPQRAPSGRYGGFTGWFQPQPELPRSQNIEPEAAPTKAPVIYTYRPDPLVELADANLTRSGGGMQWWGAKRTSKDIFEALKSGSAGVRVTEKQRDAIIAFYREREFAPIWVSGREVTQRAADVLSELADANSYGLSARDYLPSDLGSFSDDLAAFAGDRERLARLELALTAASLRYAMHASGGRIVPNRISAYHDLKPPTVDGREALVRLAEEPSPGAYLASLHPVHPAYEALRREYVALSASTERGEAPIADGPAVKPGETDARLPAIRSRLAKLGHLAPAVDETEETVEEVAAPAGIASAGVPLFGSPDADVVIEVAMEDDVDLEPVPEPEPRESAPSGAEPGAPEVSQSETYDAATVEAVKAFQAAAGLTVDGIIGQNTISAFNSGNTESRIERLAYSLERLRWMPRDFGAKHVFVNTASFEASAVENGTTIWSSKVIVGTPQNQTVSFSDQFETVVFNPYWGVPASIIVNEFAPEMRRDPSWIDREGYEVTDLNGQVISPYNVDWYNLNPKNLKFGVRQPPGPKNALGEIKFLFPNKHAIYMHDTPSKPLFDKPVRAYSHGCVRVEDPWGFAEILLGWDRERIASTLASTRNQSVPVEQEIKVHLAYFTAWPDETGAIRYYDDVYGRDQLVERALGTLTVAMR